MSFLALIKAQFQQKGRYKENERFLSDLIQDVLKAIGILNFIGNRKETGVSQHPPKSFVIKRLGAVDFLVSFDGSGGNCVSRRRSPSRHRRNDRPNCETVAPEFDTA